MRVATPAIRLTEQGFEVIGARRNDVVQLNCVVAVDAFKVDALIVDVVCCEIVTCNGGTKATCFIHEDIPGFGLAMTKLERLPGFRPGWRDAVLLPPFAAKRTMLFRRADSPS